MKVTKTMSAVDQFKADVERWKKLSYKLCSYGATDTEPDSVFQWCLHDTLNGKDFNLPTTARDWQLYTCEKGVGLAATNLTRALKRCLASLKQVTIAEQAELRSYLDGVLWRCY